MTLPVYWWCRSTCQYMYLFIMADCRLVCTGVSTWSIGESSNVRCFARAAHSFLFVLLQFAARYLVKKLTKELIKFHEILKTSLTK